MEFDFNINHLFPEVISLVGKDTLYKGNDLRKVQLQKNLQVVIEALGSKSAQAQRLTGSITSLHKTQIYGHHIYVLKEASGNNGRGSVIGFIKVGKKRLFLLDHHGNHNEMNPLCILDFYVHESQQRKGCGLRLFKHMLNSENVKASHLAIDRPSHKFISFLKKHFNLWATIPQVNNFVIFDGFFKNRTDLRSRGRGDSYSGNSHLRPLSRAFSEDVINKHRSGTSVLKDIRPLSGFETQLNSGHDPFANRNNRRRRWNPDGTWQQPNSQAASTRPNLYSRFSHERDRPNPHLVPVPPSRSFMSVRNNDVITKPYSRDRFLNGSKDPVDTTTINGIDNVKHSSYNKLSLADEEEKKENRPELKNLPPYEVLTANRMDPQVLPEVNERLTKSSLPAREGKPPSYTKYNNSSDMLSELKKKDECDMERSLTAQYQRNRRWKHQYQANSSWNVLGVPATPFWN